MRSLSLRAALTAARAPAIGLVGLLLAAPAFAAQKPAGQAEISGVVELPLYGGLRGEDPYHYVELAVGENKLLLRLATGHADVRLTEGGAKRLGLEGKGEEKKAKIDEAMLGTVKLSGVSVKVKDLDDGDYTADGELGLAAFPQLAWAILPSQGLVKVAPAESGAELTGGVGGQVLDYTSREAKKEKLGKGKEKMEAAPFIVTATWSGVPLRTELASQVTHDWIPRELEDPTPYVVDGVEVAKVDLPDAPGYEAGVERIETRDVELAGAKHTLRVVRAGIGPRWVYLSHAQASQDVLGTMDLAIDPVNKKLALKPVDTVKRADWAPTHEARLRKALEAKGEEGAAPTDEQTRDARKGGIPKLSTWLWETGRQDEALELSRELTRLEPESCNSWLTLGSRLLDAGRPQEAVEPLTKAMEMYRPWSKLALAERKDLEEQYGKAKEEKTAWEGQVPQDHACDVADGKLALAKVLTGDLAGVAQLYPANLDLDRGLPMAAGLAALKAGKYDVAEAAYRQAVQMTVGKEPHDARAGLFLALWSRDPALAQAQVSRGWGYTANGPDPLLLRTLAEAVRGAQGAPAAVAALKPMADANPTSPTILLEYGRALAAAGDNAGAQKAWDEARRTLDHDAKLTPRHAGILAVSAMLQAARGQAAEAQKQADELVKLAPSWGMSWIAQADAAEAAGDKAKAAEHRKHAGLVDADRPVYARLALQ